ncbi:MAG: DUF547 domain-containing protein [Planctomycetes bacterium]|nr:DUF547 domain-containing protein [Planctomycetota bacterium]
MKRPSLVVALAALLVAPGARALPPAETYDDLTALLKRHVDERGLVDYRTFKVQDEEALRAVVRRLGSVDPAGLADSPRALKAYWINVYNAVTLQAVLEFFPLGSLREKAEGQGYNVWDDYPFDAGGRRWSLNQIEHEVLRPLGDPRVHAALNCASVSCPRLLREAYVPARLDEQLEEQTRQWLNDPARGVRVGDGVVSLSMLFTWFGEDFGPDVPARLRWVSQYLRDPAMREAVTRRGARVEALPWDWRLNERR